jgi:uncharacterized protein YhaN
MRILRLDLLKFGPFSGVTLAFEGRPFGLHIVCGPNEAGKSSALRALRQFFYGIPNRTSDNFLHANADLRIGAVLESARGDQLHAIRRKVTSQTLRAADDDTPVDAALVADILSGVDETTFSQRFGIDYEELVRGGAAIAQGGGDLGAMLFAAGLGIADLNHIAGRLAEEADQYFKARGSLQRVNKAVAELTAARRMIKDSQLPESQWVTHDRALRDLRTRSDELSAALLEKRTEQGRLQRLGDALPIIRRRETLLAELRQVAHAPSLAADFPEDRRKAVNELQMAQTAACEATKALEAVTAAIAQLQVPPLLLEHAGAIQQLKEDLGTHRKAMKDRTVLVAKRQQNESEARKILVELGYQPELSDAAALRISRGQRRRIQELGSHHVALTSERESASAALQALQTRLTAVEREIQTISEKRDVSELGCALRRAQQHRDLATRADRARLQLEAGRQQMQIDLQRLPRWSGTLDNLELLKVPSSETIDRFETDIAKAEGQRDRMAERTTELRDDLSQLDQQIEQLRLQADVPTEADLNAARALRDEGWRSVVQHWQQPQATPDAAEVFVRHFPLCSDLASAYEASVERADELADRLRREADQVAMKAKLIAERDKKQERLHELSAKLAALDGQLQELSAQWQTLWQPMGIEPGTPREMRAWKKQQADLVAAAALHRTSESEYAELASQVCSLREELARSLHNLGEPTPQPAETLVSIVERCEQLAGRIQGAHDARLTLARDRDRLERELADARRQAAEIQDQLDRWRNDWSAAVQGLRLGSDSGPTEANSVLEALQELHEKLSDAECLRERIEGIDKDAEAFCQQTRRLTESAAPDLVQIPFEQAANDLYDRLITAQKEHARLSELRGRLQAEEQKRDKARTACTRWQATLETMCREASCQSPDQLVAAERLSSQKQTLQAAARDVEDQLLRLAAGMPLDTFVQQALQVDADHLAPTLQQLADDIRQLETQQAAAREEIGKELSELQRMDGSSRAAEAQTQVESLMAQIRNDAEQYVRLRLASTVLRQTTERYRQRNQGPVLDSASRLFSDLTRGSFRALRADFDDQGGAVLVGVRAGGQILNVECMSDGTRDQLYLALRLASLETYLADKEPLPFIVDDILIMFDDERAVAALRALARLSTRTQVIFFTHHDHLLELAANHLDAGSFFVHHLAIRV